MKKGFTLIELTMIMAIIGIMTSVGIMSFNSSRKSVTLKSAQDDVISAIKLAQNYALQGKMPTNGDIAKKYGFRFINNNTYRIFYCTVNTAACENNSIEQILVEEQTLKNEVILGIPSSQTVITFTIPSANIDMPDVSTFPLQYSAITKHVYIGMGGAITKD